MWFLWYVRNCLDHVFTDNSPLPPVSLSIYRALSSCCRCFFGFALWTPCLLPSLPPILFLHLTGTLKHTTQGKTGEQERGSAPLTFASPFFCDALYPISLYESWRGRTHRETRAGTLTHILRSLTHPAYPLSHAHVRSTLKRVLHLCVSTPSLS